MHRIKKLLWILLVLWIVFFVICDEKWYKIWFENNHIVLYKIEIKSDSEPPKVSNNYIGVQYQPSENAVYKNSDLIHLYYEFENPRNLRKWAGRTRKLSEWSFKHKNSDSIKIFSWFENPINLRKSAWMDPKYLVKLEKEKIELEAKEESMKYKWLNIISYNKDNTISNIFESNNNSGDGSISAFHYDFTIHEINLKKATETEDVISNNSEIEKEENSDWESLENNESKKEENNDWEVLDNSEIEKEENIVLENNESEKEENNDWEVLENSESEKEESNDWKALENSESEKEENNEWEVVENNESEIVESTDLEPKEEKLEVKEKISTKIIKKCETAIQSFNPKSVEVENDLPENEITWSVEWLENKEPEFEVIKYEPKIHNVFLKKWIVTQEFVVNNDENLAQNDWLNEELYEDLITDEEIDINSLESENDEFLKKVFEKTKDVEVMNLIIETYLNEYQFIKAKRFIESLPQEYVDQIDPLLNLRVSFNSFSLTSKTVNPTLTSLVKNYQSNNKISQEDALWYLWVIALMSKNYDEFFEIAWKFTLDSHQAFTSRLKWYVDQISKQMWMPDYYFDTLIALELFNHWFFQSAKVLAVSSLQKNPDYILPYQVLAYANFLTNSRDTSTEYLKKLVDLDPNNAEKYRFLMWVAYYRDEKYEQSVVMLSMIKDEKLRLDTQRYLINDYLKLNQKNKLISTRNKLLWYNGLVASDFYTYFYESFFKPYSEWWEYDIYEFDIELANKMLRVCSMTLPEEERVVCTYGTIGRNIALWHFDWIEKYLLDLVSEYPQWYLYQALWDYYVQQWDLDKAKIYLLKAISLAQEKSERSQIKKLLQDTM